MLTNNLLAVIYTNGLFRVVQISNFAILIETKLLDDQGKISADFERVVDAKIAFETHQSIPDNSRTIFTKSISFGVILVGESLRTVSKRFLLHTFNLRFDVPLAMDHDASEDSVILGNDCELIHTRQQVFEPGMIISSITAGGQSAFLYTTLNPVTRETSIFSTSSAQPIWDRGS